MSTKASYEKMKNVYTKKKDVGKYIVLLLVAISYNYDSKIEILCNEFN